MYRVLVGMVNCKEDMIMALIYIITSLLSRPCQQSRNQQGRDTSVPTIDIWEL